jgi:hypothetical protein
MANIKFLWTNEADTATLTASSVDALNPAANVIHRWPTRAWHSNALSAPEWLKFDRGSGSLAAADFFAVRYTNLTIASAIAKIQANASDSWGGPTVDYTFAASQNIMVYLPTSGISLRYIRFPFTDTSNPAGYIAVGRIGFGLSFSPSINFTDAFAWGRKDRSYQTLAEGGQISSIQRAHGRQHTYPFKALSENDVSYFEAMFAARGNSRDIWVCEDPDLAPDGTYYCRIANDFAPTHVEGTELYELTIVVEEML